MVGGANLPLIDRNWTLGQDYSKVETALACREGESVQVRGARGHGGGPKSILTNGLCQRKVALDKCVC